MTIHARKHKRSRKDSAFAVDCWGEFAFADGFVMVQVGRVDGLPLFKMRPGRGPIGLLGFVAPNEDGTVSMCAANAAALLGQVVEWRPASGSWVGEDHVGVRGGRYMQLDMYLRWRELGWVDADGYVKLPDLTP